MIYDAKKMVLFRVRRIYYDQIVAGTKKEEIRAQIARWKWLLGDDAPDIAFFACGKDRHFRRISRIYLEDPEKVLGRPLSDQGIIDLRYVKGDKAIILELGEEWSVCPRCGGLPWARYSKDDDIEFFGCDACEITFMKYEYKEPKARGDP